MQTVPSLVGTGTAIAAAASGLVFGQPTNPDPNHNLEGSKSVRRLGRKPKGKAYADRALPPHSQSNSPSRTPVPLSRWPATSPTPSQLPCSEVHVTGSGDQTSRPPLSRRQRPQLLQVLPSNPSSRRQSSLVPYQLDLLPGFSTVEASRECASSSNNSWLRRLSWRPQPQCESCRSSIAAYPSSGTFSHISTAPILPRSRSVTKTLPPNKLVKRSCSINCHREGIARQNSRGHLLGLRRPATSHQRSATLQQFRSDIDVAGSAAHPKYSFDEPIHPEELLGASPLESLDQSLRTTSSARTSSWTLYFHPRVNKRIPSSGSSKISAIGVDGGDAAPCPKSLGAKHTPITKSAAGAHLIKPRMISSSSAQSRSFASAYAEEERDRAAATYTSRVQSPTPSETTTDQAASATPRRSFSSSFSHTANWAYISSGSLRRTKRGANQGDDVNNNKRHVSAPVRGLQSSVGRCPDTTANAVIAPVQQGSTLHSAAPAPSPAPKRIASSPLPPHSNTACLHADLSRLSSVGGAAIRATRPYQPSGSSTSSAGLAMSQQRGSYHDRSSALDSSDGDARDLISGDEYDTDFRSDTMFDSLRTTGSGHVRAVDTPLESVYDESPPSIGGNKQFRRLSIQGILDRTWDQEASKIMEEDELNLTPVRLIRRADAMRESPHFALGLSSANEVAQATHDAGRFSLDDDFDEDWTRDQDAPFSGLSPSSKPNPINAGHINPNVRLALVSIEGNSAAASRVPSSMSERPLSSLFDWSEPHTQDKQSCGYSLRPKTAHSKQGSNPRGGRSVARKGPMPAHVRSQSVPVVHEVTDASRPIGSKYGTWGLSTKTVSEDWDEDFEFGIGNNNDDDGKATSDLFAVPESIRASQPSVKAHSGQIRELSLLVNDLKRLCRHGRELDMLNGDKFTLWREAEGIIALASPDEDHNEQGSEPSIYMDALESNDTDVRVDDYKAPDFDKLDAGAERKESDTSKACVVRERQSPPRPTVFPPDDDIFGSSNPSNENHNCSNQSSRPCTPDKLHDESQDVNGVVQSALASAKYRRIASASVATPASDPTAQWSRRSYNSTNRMHFDTNSLKALVRRAGELRDLLSDVIRRADQLTQSPIRTPRHERRLDSSPAFTRVFDDPGSSPPRRPFGSRGNSSAIVEHPSTENSPQSIDRRLPLMAAN